MLQLSSGSSVAAAAPTVAAPMEEDGATTLNNVATPREPTNEELICYLANVEEKLLELEEERKAPIVQSSVHLSHHGGYHLRFRRLLHKSDDSEATKQGRASPCFRVATQDLSKGVKMMWLFQRRSSEFCSSGPKGRM